MAAVIYLDTHAVAWLYAGQAERFSPPAQQAIEGNDLLISPMVVLELQYLFEIQRVTDPSRQVFDALEQAIGLTVCDLPFPRVVQRSVQQSWTRDPFDRIIVAQAALREANLVTKDRKIRARYPRALW